VFDATRSYRIPFLVAAVAALVAVAAVSLARPERATVVKERASVV
jgi:hypothetical protein